uniref:Uncharacterized protein n=1 Tax=Astatotilapia calliptera TaxID=8154 RepID=A0AAX7TLH7_ASTCA
MRLYLAVAVLMLAFVAYTEAQDDTSFTDKFDRFGQKLTEIGQSLAEKTKNAFDDIHNSEFGTSTRNLSLASNQPKILTLLVGGRYFTCHVALHRLNNYVTCKECNLLFFFFEKCNK